MKGYAIELSMAKTESKMLALGTAMPSFNLPDTERNVFSTSKLTKTKGVLVMFICNHCPYVKHLRQSLAQLTSEFMRKGLTVVGINSNDVVNFPEDAPELMVVEKREQKYEFPYLYDETQEVAKAFDAACTPDFYLFDSNQKLVYRGQYDDSRPGNNLPVTGKDLKAACEALLAQTPISPQQRPSLGCNIKWKT